jgi:hypothetical protein
MNYQELMVLLDQASAFDLFRISQVLNDMIDEPKRIIEVKSKLRMGMRVEYFDARLRKAVPVTIESIKQTRATARDDQNRRWDVPFCAINVRDIDPNVPIAPPLASGPSKSDFSVGEGVAFIDRSGLEQFGVIIRLNRKTATVQGHGVSWRVGYDLMNKVIDTRAD